MANSLRSQYKNFLLARICLRQYMKNMNLSLSTIYFYGWFPWVVAYDKYVKTCLFLCCAVNDHSGNGIGKRPIECHFLHLISCLTSWWEALLQCQHFYLVWLKIRSFLLRYWWKLGVYKEIILMISTIRIHKRFGRTFVLSSWTLEEIAYWTDGTCLSVSQKHGKP